jgi:hypothetical protein
MKRQSWLIVPMIKVWFGDNSAERGLKKSVAKARGR